MEQGKSVSEADNRIEMKGEGSSDRRVSSDTDYILTIIMIGLILFCVSCFLAFMKVEELFGSKRTVSPEIPIQTEAGRQPQF